MSKIYSRISAVLLGSSLGIASANAAEDLAIFPERVTSSWLDEHVAVRRASAPPRARYSLSRTQVWTSGLAKSDISFFDPDAFDRSLGAKLQPFTDLNLRIGTELVRSEGGNSSLTSRANWEAFWSTQSDMFGGMDLGLTTGGSMATLNTGYSQTVSGTLGIPLDLPLDRWSTQVKFSPNLNVDTASGAVGSGFLSEIMGQTVLSSQADLFKSVLNVKVGYGIAQDARPSASARLEIRISPNL